MYAEFLCGTLVTTNQKYKPLEKRMANYFFENVLIHMVKLRRNLKFVQNFFVAHR